MSEPNVRLTGVVLELTRGEHRGRFSVALDRSPSDIRQQLEAVARWFDRLFPEAK